MRRPARPPHCLVVVCGLIVATLTLISPLSASGASFGPAAPGAHAGSAGPAVSVRTSAVARVRRDHRSAARFAGDVRQVASGQVASGQVAGGQIVAENSAVAYAHCVDCRAVAIAFQVVLVSGSAPNLVADNSAEAVNEDCTGCQSLAVAYQFILVTVTPVRLAPRVRAQLDQVRQALDSLSRDPAPVAELGVRADALAARVVAVIEHPVTVHRHVRLHRGRS